VSDEVFAYAGAPAGGSRSRRLFVAFEVPAPQRAEAVRRCEAVRGALPPARWLRAEAMHVTLLFLGEVEEAQVAPLAAALAAAVAPEAPRRLRLFGLGGFPPGRPARVLWVGVECTPDPGSLRRRLAVAASGLGVALETERALHAHLTLARCARPWPIAAAERLAPAFVDPLGEAFTSSDIVLFESRLERSGAHHVPYARLALRGAA
jgi:2'-5' RNA ligase